MDEIPSRVAVLEQIAAQTATTLTELRSEIRALRTETRDDFRWLLGVVLSGIGISIGGFITLLVTVMHH
jgi:hypothetical protein